ncbi:hypothetical protein COCSUDRAFT_53175 [Coccomyxa subellipsoidea C-169]|uniref:Uncharacterized protein n=1 Tax=Coccomyxa subellipsoidea (strain C-169) TaxID=574566 RepID=I0Z013_COCSC|nr:hypothetical protein COCSUDRAFT_53175 [Coccomyxa subellipsoidea C-169]EIE23982.1 hypothetical protein COCSUDRAFT_53175 [Coccomyxa subellipsoidea C-169]|eukprot:XP_005648526.1 hypothetical protein COCSUDRAFT_53175 [Coccomyxa subellipsoidea C-169]
MSEAAARSSGMPPTAEEARTDTGAEGVDETVELLERRSREVGGNPADRATMLDPDYMAMVLAMDTLWAAGESAVTGLSQGEDCSAPEFSS